MVDEFQPSRQKSDLADVVEMLLDKGVVINADIVVSIGDTQLLGVQVRAAIASFETAAKYGLEFPEGTDMRRVAQAVDEPELAEMDRPAVPIDPTRGVNVSSVDGDDDSSSSDGGDSGGSDSDDSDSNEGDSGEDATSSDGGTDGERGTERLGARPDPDTPVEGDMDLTEDDGSSGIGESLLDVGGEGDDSDGGDGGDENESGDDSSEGAGGGR